MLVKDRAGPRWVRCGASLRFSLVVRLRFLRVRGSPRFVPLRAGRSPERASSGAGRPGEGGAGAGVGSGRARVRRGAAAAPSHGRQWRSCPPVLVLPAGRAGRSAAPSAPRTACGAGGAGLGGLSSPTLSIAHGGARSQKAAVGGQKWRQRFPFLGLENSLRWWILGLRNRLSCVAPGSEIQVKSCIFGTGDQAQRWVWAQKWAVREVVWLVLQGVGGRGRGRCVDLPGWGLVGSDTGVQEPDVLVLESCRKDSLTLFGKC